MGGWLKETKRRRRRRKDRRRTFSCDHKMHLFTVDHAHAPAHETLLLLLLLLPCTVYQILHDCNKRDSAESEVVAEPGDYAHFIQSSFIRSIKRLRENEPAVCCSRWAYTRPMYSRGRLQQRVAHPFSFIRLQTKSSKLKVVCIIATSSY